MSALIAYELPAAMHAQHYAQSAPAFGRSGGSTRPPGVSVITVSTISGATIYAFVARAEPRVSHLDSAEFTRIKAQRVEGASVLSEQWKKLLLDRDAAVNANALTLTARPVFQALLQFGPGAVDLRDLPVERVNGVHLAVILRATLTKKNLTPGWADALSVARAAIARDKLSEADALGGLI